MLRGELAIAVLVILTIVMLIDLITGHAESLGQWLSIIAVSAVLTGINALIHKLRKGPE